MSIHHYSACLVLIGLFSLTACDTFEDNGPSRESVTGDYDTETLTVKTDSGTVDALAKGTYIEMKLAPGNEVKEGSLFVSPEFTEEDTEGSRRIGFAGTWARPTDSTITFDHQADPFIRDTKWYYDSDTLRTSTSEVKAVLVRRGKGAS